VTPPLIVALDYPDVGSAIGMVDRLGDACDFYKVGLELYTAAGPEVVRSLTGRGKDVFLDLKLHDIPNTVRAASRAAAALEVRLLTVHAVGGAAMLAAAVEGAGARCAVLGVTVLTSLDAARLGEAWGRAEVDILDEVVRLAGAAREAGAHGVVCGGGEVGAVRDAYGGALRALVPGIRPAGSATHDQARAATPAAAVAAGAGYLVLGRAVTAAADPVAALAAIRDEVARASDAAGAR
jgi:orotidine-5'-phosphate decarboxylase